MDKRETVVLNDTEAFGAFFEKSYCPMWILNPENLSFVQVNDAALQQYGYSREEFLNIRLPQLRVENDKHLGIHIHELVNNRDKGIFYNAGNSMHKKKDGTILHLRVYAQSVIYKGRKASLAFLIDDDTNAFKDALKEKANELEAILDSIRDGFFELDKNWNFIYVNKEFERMYACTRADMIGIHYWTKFPEAVRQQFYTMYHYAVDNQCPVHFEEYASSLNKWVSINAYPNSKGLIVYFTDISRQKSLQDKIVYDEQNLRALINNTTDIMWSVNRELKIISANQMYKESVVKVTGTIPETDDYVLNSAYDTIQLSKWQERYSSVLEGAPYSIIDENSTGGRMKYTEINLNPIFDNENNVIGASCLARDITRQQSAYLKVEAQNDRLKEIAWIQSHQVRGPLSTLLGLLEVVNVTQISEENLEIFMGVKTAAKQLDDIIKEINNKAKY